MVEDDNMRRLTELSEAFDRSISTYHEDEEFSPELLELAERAIEACAKRMKEQKMTDLQRGFDGSAVRVGPNHSTLEIWFDTEEQARAARKRFLDWLDTEAQPVNTSSASGSPSSESPAAR